MCRQSAIDALAELRAYAPSRQWRLIQVAGSLEDLDKNKSHLLGEAHTTLHEQHAAVVGVRRAYCICWSRLGTCQTSYYHLWPELMQVRSGICPVSLLAFYALHCT